MSGDARLVIWRCSICGRTWHKSGAKPRNFCHGDSRKRHVGTEMARVEVLPADSVAGLVEAVKAMPNTRDQNIAGWWEVKIKPLLDSLPTQPEPEQGGNE